MKKLFILLLMCLLQFSIGVRAQEVLLMTSEMLDKNAKATLNRMYVTDTRVLIESDDKDQPMTTLYDAKKEEMYLIDHKKKEFYLMDKAALAEMNAHMKTAMQQLDQQLKQLPENQRKMLEEQMRKMYGIQEPVTYEKQAGATPVKNWKSTKYLGKSGDQLRHEVYVASYKELGEDKDKFKALLSFYALLQDQLQEMSRSMPAMMALTASNMPGAEEGMPVKTIYYDQQGKPEITSTLNSIEESTLDEEKWQVPPKYKQKKFMASDK